MLRRGTFRKGVFRACREDFPQCCGRAVNGPDQCTCGEYTLEQKHAAINHDITAETEGEFKRALAEAERKGARPIFYLPDPFNRDKCYELATIKRGESCKLARPWWESPENARLLRPEDIACMRIIRADLDGWRDFNSLPTSVGPHVILGEPRC
jgi:hypothetical protein